EAFAAHLRHVARIFPAERHKRVVLIIDSAPWHRGKPIDDALADHPHLESSRLPSSSPHGVVARRVPGSSELWYTEASRRTLRITPDPTYLDARSPSPDQARLPHPQLVRVQRRPGPQGLADPLGRSGGPGRLALPGPGPAGGSVPVQRHGHRVPAHPA